MHFWVTNCLPHRFTATTALCVPYRLTVLCFSRARSGRAGAATRGVYPAANGDRKQRQPAIQEPGGQRHQRGGRGAHGLRDAETDQQVRLMFFEMQKQINRYVPWPSRCRNRSTRRWEGRERERERKRGGGGGGSGLGLTDVWRGEEVMR